MLACPRCNYTADEEDSEGWVQCTEILHLGELGNKTEHFLCCPECGCLDLVEAQQCEHCHEYFNPDTLVVAKVTCPPDDEYPYETEDIRMVCVNCYEEHYFKEEDL